MHLRQIQIHNFRSVRSFDWKLPDSKPGAGWHVVVGDNGSGKSSFLRFAALALIGPRDALALRLPWEDWLRKGEEKGSIQVAISANPKYDKFTGKGPKPKAAAPDLDVVHLHPTWQRRVGFWFRKHFFNIQFIVTTHSPLICPAAAVGSIYLLPQPGELDDGGMLGGTRLKRLIDGNVLDAYSTEVFGKGVTRSEHSKVKLRRLAELNSLEQAQRLSAAQKKEQEELRGTMPTASSVLSPSDDPDS
jgi:hypothetical protein